MPETIKYRDGYKYQLHEDYGVKTALIGFGAINHDFIYLTDNGWLAIKAGYAWDGCSGPTIDCAKSMRASLIHDALYQLGREGLLPPSAKDLADKEFYRAMTEDGFNFLRAWTYYHMVCLFGKSSYVKQAEIVKEAP